MKINGNLALVVFAAFGVAIFSIWTIQPKCEGSFNISFVPKEFGFNCQLPAVNASERQIISDVTSNGATNSSVQSTSPTSTVSCNSVRGSITFRRKFGDSSLADSRCQNIVHAVPANYANNPNVFRVQDDNSVTFNTGVKHNDLEVWCNCHPN
jgi:hypothetical protein